MKALGEWLESTGTSQAALARDLEVSQAHISNLVNGTNSASTNLLKRISRRTRLSIDALLSDSPPPIPSSSSDHAA